MERLITKSKSLFFFHYQRIKSLDLSHASLGESGARLLFNFLCQASSLMRLNLNGNNIGDGCAKELEEFLRLNPGVSELYLAYN